VGAPFDGGAVQIFPAVKLSDQKTGVVFEPGVQALQRVIAARDDWKRLLGSETLLREVLLASGGHLRDLLRILSEVIRRARSLPVNQAVVQSAIDQIRTEFLPIPNSDARWLARVAATHKTQIEDLEQLPDLARFFDTHVVLCYRDGPESYDVHPLIKQIVIEQAEESEAYRKANPLASG
jgi:hypothetical protein